MRSLRELFGPRGPFASELGAYEERPGQLAMAEAVERALREDRLLLCEAGTGTGKTLAYLVPALLSGRKVVVSTATRALEEQIVSKDIPIACRALGIEPRIALMKGVSNYLCRRRHAEFVKSPESLRPGYARSFAQVQSFVAETETGDLSELAGLPEDDPVRLEVASSTDTRIGSACSYYDECFVTRMKREAEAAQLVVVNHHLFFADVALRGPHPARVLPDYDAVVFDEAHQLEDIATEFFSVRVSSARIARLLEDLQRALSQSGAADPLFARTPVAGEGPSGVLALVERAAAAFFAELGARVESGEGRIAIEPDVFSGDLQRRAFELDSALEGLAALAASAAGRLVEAPDRVTRRRGEALSLLERRAEQLREQLSIVVEGGRGRVVWLERTPRRVTLSSSPVDLSILLRERVFERVPACVLTSATLSTGGSERPGTSPFAYVRARLGLDDPTQPVDELVVGSPFDFARQAVLYTPRDLPAPGTVEFLDAASERITELVSLTGGGAFVLTTSVRAMRELHRRLAATLGGYPLMVQGEAPKAALVARFRAAENAVLVATMGFWEGVDVPGRALRLVILEKIPFAVPTDPILVARSRALEEAGKNPFLELSVPAAALSLKQGFGRLIRSQQDFGIVALLDERVHRRGYGARLLAALPPAVRVTDLEPVRRFWEAADR
ncbi:MAG: ATP-dependent DNA helicase [Pseudomonadota bacterium]|nr:MAG: ATP-dependent DNA helicase [Pseudomonadota bacterium]